MDTPESLAGLAPDRPPVLPDAELARLHDAFRGLREALSAEIVGQAALIERLLIALLADGHLLVEGAPGLAKTSAVRALAARLEADFARVQFTPDLLPADLTGTEVWRDASLKHRGLSAPAVVGDYVVVADLDGYVHWFDRITGTIAGRSKAGGDRVTNAPLVVDGTLYVINDKGELTALRGQPIAARAASR